jgi:predicted TPR repeat methyltransferase
VGPNLRAVLRLPTAPLAWQPAAAMETDVWNEQVAQGFDASSAPMYAPEVLGPTVDFLARRAGHGPALEFAIGTGRVALALRARSVPVAGIDLSEPMVAELGSAQG